MGRQYSTSREANCSLDVKRSKWKKWIENCMDISQPTVTTGNELRGINEEIKISETLKIFEN